MLTEDEVQPGDSVEVIAVFGEKVTRYGLCTAGPYQQSQIGVDINGTVWSFGNNETWCYTNGTWHHPAMPSWINANGLMMTRDPGGKLIRWNGYSERSIEAPLPGHDVFVGDIIDGDVKIGTWLNIAKTEVWWQISYSGNLVDFHQLRSIGIIPVTVSVTVVPIDSTTTLSLIVVNIHSF